MDRPDIFVRSVSSIPLPGEPGLADKIRSIPSIPAAYAVAAARFRHQNIRPNSPRSQMTMNWLAMNMEL